MAEQDSTLAWANLVSMSIVDTEEDEVSNAEDGSPATIPTYTPPIRPALVYQVRQFAMWVAVNDPGTFHVHGMDYWLL